MIRRRKVVIDYHQKFGDEQGGRILADLRKRCVLFDGGVDVGKGVDVNRLLVMEGEANVLKYIYRMLGTDPNKVRQEAARNEIPNITSVGD